MSAILNRTLLLAPAAMLLVAICWSSQLQAKQEQSADSSDQELSSKIDSSSKPGGNLITNGGFANKDNWSFEIKKNMGVVATADFDGVARIERKDGGRSRWAVRLIQDGLNLKPDVKYRVSFRAKAESSSRFSFRMQKKSPQAVAYSDFFFVEATNDWTTESHEFTMGTAGDTIARIVFNIGKDSGTLLIDDVRIEELTGAPVVTATADGNLLKNGSFATDDNWVLHKHDGAKATVKFDGMASVVREAGGPKGWSIQFANDSLNLEPESHYRLSFRTWAERPTSYNVQIGNSITHDLYSHRHQVKVSNSWFQVRHEFSTSKAYANARIVLNMGRGTGKVLVDDVKIEKIESSSVAAKSASGSAKGDVVTNLQDRVNALVDTKRRTKEQRLELDKLKMQLEVAQYLEKQVVLTKMTEFSTGELTNEKFAGEDDHFVIAKIRVGKKSKVAEFEFVSAECYLKCTHDLYYFLKDSGGGYRDYRILGRFSDAKLTKAALAEVRSSYDAHKEEQARMLAYIQQRARESQQSKDRARSLMSKMGGGGSGGSGNGGGVTSCRRT